MQRLCVYCGSSRGADGRFAAAAVELAGCLVASGTDLVYGGGRRGIMGVLADAVLAGGGRVFGVIPQALHGREVAHDGLTELRVVASMHERKALMAGMADGFVALPGGFGTLEEIVEILTWAQLQFHRKPCGFLNTAGYFDALLAFFDHARDQGFVRAAHRDMVQVAASPGELLARMRDYRPGDVTKLD